MADDVQVIDRGLWRYENPPPVVVYWWDQIDFSHNYCGTGKMPVQDALFRRCLNHSIFDNLATSHHENNRNTGY
jgi:hypothetical protein